MTIDRSKPPPGWVADGGVGDGSLYWCPDPGPALGIEEAWAKADEEVAPYVAEARADERAKVVASLRARAASLYRLSNEQMLVGVDMLHAMADAIERGELD